MCNILPDSTNKEMEVNEMPDARKPATFGSNDDRLEQIPWHSENDLEEAILDELTDLSTRETRTDAEQARLAELFDQLEQFDHPETTLSDGIIEARLHELRERVQVPFAEDSATTAVAQKIKLKNEKSIDDTKTSSIHSRKALKLLPLAAVLVLLIGAVSAQAFGEDFFDLFAKWTSEIFHLDDSAKPEASIGHNDLEEGEVREYATPQEMLNDFGIKGQLIPTEVPEEFGTPTCWASKDECGLKIEILYENKEHYILFWYKQITKDNTVDVEKNDHMITSWNYGGIKHYQLTDNGIEKIAWVNGSFECLAQSNTESEVFCQVVESIYGG